ncbi:hypothetical protein RP20_CCG014626 [Aedes albopictus]|nr:hypothetical protein RP20_CCG014626 [Aedes albopictus]
MVIQFNGGTISWACRKQSCVSLSTAEAEFVALAEATQEMLWVKRLLGDLGEEQQDPLLYEDNQSALKMLDVGKFSNRTKHIATKYHFVRDIKTSGEICFVYCPTKDMVADLLTKPIGGTRLAQLRTMCGLQDQR